MNLYFDFAAFFGLGIVDSINPSAIAMSIYLLTKESQQKAISNMLFYICGVFLSYFAIGVLLVIGIDFIVTHLSSFFESRESYYVQLALGAVMFLWSLPDSKKKEREKYENVTFSSNMKLFLIGIAITLSELVTAVPYFGAIALLQHSGLSLSVKIISLLLYNIIFILPPLILLGVYLLQRNRFENWLQRRREKKKDKPSGEAVKWIVGILGFLIAADAINVLWVS